MPSKDALLEEIRQRRDYAEDEWKPIREEGRKDVLCVAGQPWQAMDPAGLRQREDAHRPHLSLDELGQYLNQSINDVRANPRGIKFSPTGNGADDKGAEFYQAKAREIEYRSHAHEAYAIAYQEALQRSYGWVRVRTDYEHDRSTHQDIFIEPVVNPDQVLPDPDFVKADGSDLRYLFYVESRSKSEFKREFPKASVQSFGGELQRLAPRWLRGDRVEVAEYWAKERYSRRLLLLMPGSGMQAPMPGAGALMAAGAAPGMVGMAGAAPGPFGPGATGAGPGMGTGSVAEPEPLALFEDELDGALPPGYVVARERSADGWRVRQYLTNGIEILRETEWAGQYIPFAACLGKIIYVDEGAGARRQILSMTRLARDPYMLYCYAATCEAEVIGATPKFPYFAYEGQLSPQWQKELAKSLHEPVAMILVKPTIDTLPVGSVLPFPQRQSWDAPIVGLEAAKEGARRAIQAAMGISPLPTPVQRENQKSGAALRQIESSGQKGSWHFVDHYETMIRHVGVMVEDLMDKILDTRRDTWVQESDGTPRQVRINDPAHPKSISTRGSYQVTVSTGPSTDSQREDAKNFVDALTANIGIVAQLVGPQPAAAVLAKSIKLKGLGPIGDQVADIIEPAQFKSQNGKEPPSQREMAAMGQLQQMQQQLQQAKQAIATDQVKAQNALQLKAMDIEFQREKLQRDSETKLAVAQLSAKVDRIALFLEERHRLGMLHESVRERVHDKVERAHDRAHAANMLALEHEHAGEQAEAAAQAQADADAQDSAIDETGA